MRVAGIACDTPRVDCRDAPEYQRYLCLRQRRCSCHVGDVAHRSIAAERDVEESGTDSASENPALERASARVRNIENRLIQQRLGREPRRGKEKLLLRVKPAVYSGIDRWPAVVEPEVRVSPHRIRHQHVGGLMGEDAARESERKKAPVVVRMSGRGCLRSRESRDAGSKRGQRETDEDCARESQICYVVRQINLPGASN